MLMGTLIRFKEVFNENLPVAEVLPDLAAAHPARYDGMRIRELAEQMHRFLKEHQASELQIRAYDRLPEQGTTPTEAYQHIIRKHTREVFLDDILGEVLLTMVAPYPPGIPVVMPGERLTEETRHIVEYLKLLEAFDNEFPGLENEVHGAEVRFLDGKRRYAIHCLAS